MASESILMRADGAGSVHELVDYLRAGKINFSVGFDLTAEVRQAIIDRPESVWALAVCQDGADQTWEMPPPPAPQSEPSFHTCSAGGKVGSVIVVPPADRT